MVGFPSHKKNNAIYEGMTSTEFQSAREFQEVLTHDR